MSEEKNWKQRVLETEIVSGHCPECEMYTILVGLNRSFYRCVNCGADLEQRVNGVIKYVIADRETDFKRRNLDENQDG